MKSLIELQQYRKCIVLFMVGVICTAMAFVIYIIDPVTAIVQYKLKMSPNSLIFALWRKPPIEVYVNVYIFNITNSEAFFKGEENLKVDELGPYVYQEILENQNITWNANGTVSYVPKRTVIFRRDMSVGSTNETYVTVANIPMLGISSALHDAGFLVNYPFLQLAGLLGSQPILNMTVHDYLWGYEDSLVTLAGTVVPSYINFRKFGLLDRMYDEGENLINMNIKGNEDMVDEVGRYLSLESINGSPGLTNWGYEEPEGGEPRPENTKCNRIQGATEATVFPPNMDTNAVFRVYRKAFCRPIPIAFVKEVERNGLRGYQYTLPDNYADPPEQNPENDCYCRDKSNCLKRGLLDLTPCYYNIPAAASLPHFLNADPSLSDGIEGMNPDVEKHGSVIILQPNIGIPMYVHSRLQTNLVMRETYYNDKIKAFNGLTVPLFWTDLVIPSLPDDLLMLLKLGVKIAPVTQIVVCIALLVGGVGCICWSLARTIIIVQEEQRAAEAADIERRNSADPRIPLGYPYPAIRLLPAIKKITSKTDIFT